MKDRKETVLCPESRETYRKPQLRRVQLVTGEVLAEGCKLNDGGKNLGMDNITCRQPVICANAGS
jgi:hypothetical protein